MENGMNKEKIIVPKGIRYISEWDGYDLEDYNYPHILNKVLTGCGFTEYCLRNNQNIILLSPRKFLLENKEDQHPGEIYYARNEFSEIVDYETDISTFHKKKPTKEVTEEEIKTSVLKMKEGIKEYCRSRILKSKKILVTYDSFRHVKDALTEIGLFQYFQVVVDEFQSIFIDSRFKSSTELELLENLEGINRICFVSATPMLDKYLDMLDEFKDLPYLEFDWTTEDPSRIIKPELEVRFTGKTLNEEAKRVVDGYQKGKYETKLNSETGGLSESCEATLFMNSVKGICQTIRSCKLHTGDCNILCARTSENEKEVRKAFNDVLKKEAKEKGLEKYPHIPRDYEVIGRIPKKGEPHKMFTFCTRTVYLGADFYSTNSKTFIFSDSNVSCLSVDISMDLEQILGRQRLDENPWKNSATIYIKTTSERNKMVKKDFDDILDEKKNSTLDLLRIYEKGSVNEKRSLAIKFEKDAKNSKYKDDYVAVNHHSGSSLMPVFNNLVMVSEMRAFEIQQIDYKDRFSVFNSLKKKGLIDEEYDVTKEVEEFNKISYATEKLKYLVKFAERPDISSQHINNFLAQIPGKYGDYYRLLGPDRIRANSFQESKIKAEWIKTHSEVKIDDGMIEKIYSTFKIGEKYSKSSIKSTLKEIYSEHNFDKTAKASDLTDYFILKNTTVKENEEWVRGFEILGKK